MCPRLLEHPVEHITPCSVELVVVTRPFPRVGGGRPWNPRGYCRQLPKAWTKGHIEKRSHQRASNAKSP